MTDPTFVLVHGALTDASVWHPVIARLHAAGRTAIAPSLPMRSFADDAAVVRGVLDGVDGPVVLAAHSYAGAVISSPDAITDSVRALVFVAAFQADAGETAAGLNGRFPGSGLVPDNLVVRPVPGGADVTLKPDRFAEVYAAGVPAAHAAVMAAAQRPFDPASLDGTFIGSPTWRALPSWAVVATADRSIPTAALRCMARRAGSTVTEVDSGHAVPVARPDVVVRALEAAAAAIPA